MKYCFFFMLAFFSACSMTEKPARKAAVNLPGAERAALRFPEAAALPYPADSLWFDALDFNDTLTDEALRFLTLNPDESVDTAMLGNVYRMNARKRRGTYGAYVDSLDIGELHDAAAHPLVKMKHSNDVLFLWALSYASYEACPWYSGCDIYLTVVPEKAAAYCMKVGERVSAADAPAYMTRITTFTLAENGDLFQEKLEETGEGDAMPERERQTSSGRWKK